jgi:hypothetical protein
MMDTPAVVMKKVKAEAITGSLFEKPGPGSRSAATCREASSNCELNSASKKLNVSFYNFRLRHR